MKSRTQRPIDQKRQIPPQKRLPLIFVLFLDLSLAGIGLIIFALFHHVIPQALPVNTTQLMMPVNTDDTRPATSDSDSTSAAKQTQTSSLQDSLPTDVTDSTKTDPTNDESSDPTGWRHQFSDQFTEGTVEITETTYRSQDLSITITKNQRDDAVYYLADIYITSLDFFRTAFAADTYGKGFTEPVLDISRNQEAIVAITGDYYGIRDFGIVVRNGVLYRDNLFEDVLILYSDGRMETVSASGFKPDMLENEGVWQAWSFGPMLLDQGQPMETFNSRVTPDNPRSAIGFFEPGHYCFVVVDGRQPGYSNGMTLTELSELFASLGCRVAYNLDGGQSATLVFMDRIVNQPYNGGREISDIVYIHENQSAD